MLRRLLIVAVIVVCAGFACAQTVLPIAQVGVPYQVQLGAAVNGAYPFTFTFDSLPSWLKSTPAGLVSGTPKSTDITSQPSSIKIAVTDALNKSMGTFEFLISVSNAPPVFIAGSSTPILQTQAQVAPVEPSSQPAPTVSQPAAGDSSSATKAGVDKNSTQPDAPTLHDPLENGATAVRGTAQSSAGVVLIKSRQGDKHHEVLRTTASPDGEFSIPVKLNAGDGIEVRQTVNGASSDSVRRIVSYPQQGDIPVATFASSFVQQFGQLKVNQLAQSAEYLTGLEIRLLSSKFPFLGRSEETRQHFNLGLFGGAGATGPMDPNSTLHVFEVPSPGSPQRPAFDKDFPGVTTPLIGFVSPDRDSFLRQYLVGLRLTTTYMDKYARSPLIAAPAMFSIALGQNELVTRGKLQGMVLRTEAFYPLPFFDRSQDKRGMLSALYLFGSSQIHLGRSRNLTPLILNPSTVSGSDPTVTIRSVPGNRDIYRIGFGIDLVQAIMSLSHPPDTTPGS